MTFNNQDWARRQESTDADRREYERERLILWTTDFLAEMMGRSNVSKADLARKLGTSRAHVTQILSGSRNVTLNTLADAAWALGKRAVVKFEPLRSGQFISSPVVAIASGQPRIVMLDTPASNDQFEESDTNIDAMCAGAM